MKFVKSLYRNQLSYSNLLKLVYINEAGPDPCNKGRGQRKGAGRTEARAGTGKRTEGKREGLGSEGKRIEWGQKAGQREELQDKHIWFHPSTPNEFLPTPL